MRLGRRGGALLLAALVAAQGCGTSPPPREEPRRSTVALRTGWPDLGPLELLDALVGTREPFVTFAGDAPAGWLRDEHVPELLRRATSERPAAYVVSALSSQLPPQGARSTEGREALFLIEGLKAGRYPPALSSASYFEPDLEGARRWWESRAR